MKNIVLVGLMGTGKTAVAQNLAQRLGLRYVSTDALIQQREGVTINDIFSKKGEVYFREVEAHVAGEVSRYSGCVVDTGGGIVLRNENISALQENGIIICLTADADTICVRTARCKHRPLLNVADPKKKIEELLKSREPFYAKAAYRIDTSRLTVDEVVDNIVTLVKDGA